MADHGWLEPPFIGCTPRLGTYSTAVRGRECEAWISEWGWNTDVYAALDDDADFGGFRGRLVQTEFVPGFTDAEVLKLRAAFEVLCV